LTGDRDQTEHAGDVDNVSVTGGDQVRQKGVGSVDHSPEIDIDDPLDVLELGILCAARLRARARPMPEPAAVMTAT